MTVNEDQTSQEAELTDGVISIVHSLCSLLSDDAHTDMSSTNHLYIVRTISDAQSHNFLVPFSNETGELRLLILARSTGNHGLARLSDYQKLSIK